MKIVCCASDNHTGCPLGSGSGARSCTTRTTTAGSLTRAWLRSAAPLEAGGAGGSRAVAVAAGNIVRQCGPGRVPSCRHARVSGSPSRLETSVDEIAAKAADRPVGVGAGVLTVGGAAAATAADGLAGVDPASGQSPGQPCGQGQGAYSAEYCLGVHDWGHHTSGGRRWCSCTPGTSRGCTGGSSGYSEQPARATV